MQIGRALQVDIPVTLGNATDFDAKRTEIWVWDRSQASSIFTSINMHIKKKL